MMASRSQVRSGSASRRVPNFGAEVRAIDVAQLKRGLSAMAALAGDVPSTPAHRAGSLAASPAKVSAKDSRRTSAVSAQRAKVKTEAKPKAKGKSASKAAAKATAKSPTSRSGARTKPGSVPIIKDSSRRSPRRSSQKKIICEQLKGITKSDMRRVARRAGCQRMATEIYNEARVALQVFLDKVLVDTCVFTEYGKRKTTSHEDVIAGLRRQGRIVYGK